MFDLEMRMALFNVGQSLLFSDFLMYLFIFFYFDYSHPHYFLFIFAF